MTIDTEILELAKIKGINLSKECNDYLKALLSTDIKAIPTDQAAIMQELKNNELKLMEFNKNNELLKRKLKEIDDKKQQEIERRARQHDLGQYKRR
jgi:transcriptional regulator of heat shock response